MSQFLLITGGCRSGKSDYAVRWAKERNASTLFLATCVPGTDAEMQARVAAHRGQRPAEWKLREEGYTPAQALDAAEEAAVILDCVPTWLGNLLVRGDTEAEIHRAGRELIAAIERCQAEWVAVVSAEVGAGLVPETELGRRFRDDVGRANQWLAAAAARVVLMVAGIPLEVK